MLVRVVSGGQTGVDRAALDAAMTAGIAIGGWAPKGRRAEDGTIPSAYPLRETPARRYTQRTEWNVRDADATLALTRGAVSGGTRLTIDLAHLAARPLLVIDLAGDVDAESAAADVRDWIEGERIGTLNVAGPRESQAPGIYKQARGLLDRAFAPQTEACS